jgi:hypothetical protein
VLNRRASHDATPEPAVLIGAVMLLLLASVPLAGGDLRRLEYLHLKVVWLLPTALAAQVLITDVVPGWPAGPLIAIHLATYVAAAVFVWCNRTLRGLPLLAVGAALNGVTIAVNGGTLPASATALRLAGITEKAGDFANSGVLAHPHLAFLGDVFALPSSWPLANVFSIGDVIILIGAGWTLHRICRRPHARSTPTRPAAARVQLNAEHNDAAAVALAVEEQQHGHHPNHSGQADPIVHPKD